MARFHPVDVHIGLRIMQRRLLLGMSQTDLAAGIGKAFQQIQKYEKGKNRVSASVLFEFATILDVPISYFYDEMDAATSGKRKPGGAKAKRTANEGTNFGKREALELVRAYYKIKDLDQRKRLANLVSALARP